MKVFVTGAAGYIGGSVAQRLLEDGHYVVGLVRSREKADLLRERGVEPVIGTLDDKDILGGAALDAEATINAADSDHRVAVEVLVKALSGTGKTLIQTSGSSIVCDDARGGDAGEAVYLDDQPYQPMSHRFQRIAIDQVVRVAGVKNGMRTIVICPTMVYGRGLGLTSESDQLPKLFAMSRMEGAGVYVGTGRPIWSNVYIADLARLYVDALKIAPSASFFFAENGEATFRQIALAVSNALGFEGRVRSWTYEAAVQELGEFARIALATNSRVSARNARLALQWNPRGPDLYEAVTEDL